jgi:protein-disulfide isomerase
MQIRSINRQRLASIAILWLAVLTLSLGVMGCSLKSAGSAPADLEAQVLQIIKDNPVVIIEAVQAYQQQQAEEQQQSKLEVIDQLKADPKAFTGDSPVMGPKDYKIVLVEFSDFQCPFCAKAHQTVKQFMQSHQDEITFVYKHLPLESIHPEATPAALAAWAAGQQGKFWEYHEALFTSQAKLGDEFYVATAKELGLKVDKFNSDRASAAAKAAIEEDLELADKLGLKGTPFFLLNGIPLNGAVPLNKFEAALAQAKQPVASPTP